MNVFYGDPHVAYVALEPELMPGLMWVMSVFTHPPYRNQGRAKALLQEVCRDADQRGLKLMLAVWPNECNIQVAGLVHLYESVGFQIQYGSTMVREAKCSSTTVT